MDEEIIISLISASSALGVGLITAVCSYKGVKKSADKHNDDILSEFKTHNAVVDNKIDNLTEKVNRHNCVIERTFKLEERMSIQEEKQSVANHRIDDLERDNKNENH